MTPEEWARVFDAGARAAHGTPVLAGPPLAVDRALTAMAEAAREIARERGVTGAR